MHLNFLYVDKKIIMYFGLKNNQPLQLLSANMIISAKCSASAGLGFTLKLPELLDPYSVAIY